MLSISGQQMAHLFKSFSLLCKYYSIKKKNLKKLIFSVKVLSVFVCPEQERQNKAQATSVPLRKSA